MSECNNNNNNNIVGRYALALFLLVRRENEECHYAIRAAAESREEREKIIFVILYRGRLQRAIAADLSPSEPVQPTRPDERGGGSGPAFLFLTCRSATPPGPQRASVEARSAGRETVRRTRNDPPDANNDPPNAARLYSSSQKSVTTAIYSTATI